MTPPRQPINDTPASFTGLSVVESLELARILLARWRHDRRIQLGQVCLVDVEWDLAAAAD